MAIAVATEPFVEAAPEDVGMSSAGLRNVSRLVQRYIDAEKFPGAISLVASNAQALYPEAAANSPTEAAEELIEFFDAVDDWAEKYEYLIDIGSKLSPMRRQLPRRRWSSTQN